MRYFLKMIGNKNGYLYYFVVIILLLSSCTITRKVPEGKYYLGANSFEVKGGNFNKVEKSTLKQRFNNQLDDSSQTSVKDVLFLLHFITRPPVFDTAYAARSARNIEASMFHIGYYNAKTTYRADTIGKKVNVHYVVEAGKPTLIDTVSYFLKKPDIQEIVNNSLDKKVLVPNRPITKVAVTGEIARIVDSLRNHGYYKFTSAELRVRGDTTIAALTQIGDNPFEDLLLLAEAQAQKDSPKIKLAVVLNPTNDSSKLEQYRIRNIYVLPDFAATDRLTDSFGINERKNEHYIIRYHESLFKISFLARTIPLRSGDIFSQKRYNETLSNLSKAGVWQSSNIRILEVPDSNVVDLVIELVPAKKFGFEASLEASYSAVTNTSNALAGNLFGFSTNFSLTNRNIAKQAIRMTHSIRAGLELNNRNRTNTSLINSTELGYRNNITLPKLLTPFPKLNNNKGFKGETFVNTSLAYNNRLGLFNIQNFNLNYGFTIKRKYERKWSFRLLNAEFSYLFNETAAFQTIINDNPFLRYAYNTAFIFGTGASYSSVYRNPKHVTSLSKERTFTANFEESGLTIGRILPILKKYKRNYFKTDFEYKYTVTYPKTALAFRMFMGVGIPVGKKDTSLPFFKQYYGGGSNSMRGWPVRGIGLGGQKLADITNNNSFNNRTGDLQFESNVEYRYIISQIIPNTLTLGGAVFIDAGNIWNVKNSTPGIPDSAQFKIKNFYKQLGVSAGTGFRLDFNYFVLRLDLGFRFKRPETSYINDGWHVPNIGFKDAFKKLFSGSFDNRKWRYENFNFTIGINYPF